MKVMVFGSFDTLHDGHRALFAQAREHGDVYVVVARDESIKLLKNRQPRLSESDRVGAVQSEADVHRAVLGDSRDFFVVIEDYSPDILLLGYDQTTFSEENIAAELETRGLTCDPIEDLGYGLASAFTLPGGSTIGFYEPRHKRPS